MSESSGSSPTGPSERDRAAQTEAAAGHSGVDHDAETGKLGSAASRLFDLRLMIGTLFVIYGVLLTIYSFFDSPSEIQRAAGIHVNLWLGLSMLVLGLIFFLWARLRPQRPPTPSEETHRPMEE
jgi:hypothetical protein